MTNNPPPTNGGNVNLIEALQDKNRKCREFIVELEEAAKLLGHESIDDDPGLKASKLINQGMIDLGERAIASGDVVAMVKAAAVHGIGDPD